MITLVLLLDLLLVPQSNTLLIPRERNWHIEHHYVYPANEMYFLQRLKPSTNFFKYNFKYRLFPENLTDSKELRAEDYGLEDVFYEFEYLHYSTFIMFFSENQIDVPRCFRKTKSVRRRINENDFLKFNNYFMRHGLRYMSWSLLSGILYDLNRLLWVRQFSDSPRITSWKVIFLQLSSLSTNSKQPYFYGSLKKDYTSYGRVFNQAGKQIDFRLLVQKQLLKNMLQMSPTFSFYIYKVDKQIFKNTRGKSGKFTFIWKYVSSYKRLSLVMFWLMKEVRVRPGRTIFDRMHSVFTDLLLHPQATWIYRVKKFSNNYVYYNSRKTLGETYRTSTH